MQSCQQNPEKYYGDRTKSSLTKHAMQFVKSKVMELWQGIEFYLFIFLFKSGNNKIDIQDV